MKQGFCILTFLALTLVCCGKYSYKISDFRPELKNHIEKIVAEGEISYNPDTLALNFLKNSCTKDELIKLLNFENPLVRVRAYRAIVNRNEPDYFQILLNHLDDTAKVIWWYFDDVADEFMVSDLNILKVENENKLTQPQKDSLIDAVLTKHLYLRAAKWMIAEVGPNEKYYPIIKSRAQKISNYQDFGIVYPLAKFKKQEDIPLLKKILGEYSNNTSENYFRAIEVFPDTAFFPIITKIFDPVVKKQVKLPNLKLKYSCRAVAQYKCQKSLDILVALTKKESYLYGDFFFENKEDVFRAIHKYKSPVYDSLYNALKPQMSEYVIKYLDKPDDDE